MKFKHKLTAAIGLVTLAVLSRFVPHLWNMTPLAAVGILAGARLGLGWGIGVPLIAMAISDPILGLSGFPIMISIYFSFGLTGVIGYLVRNSRKLAAILGGSFLSTMVFFLTTNAAVWQFGTMYPHSLSGLLMSYIAGLPFLQNQIIGDLFFAAGLFAVWELVRAAYSKVNLAKESSEARISQ